MAGGSTEAPAPAARIISGMIRVNGVPAEASLTTADGGRIRWRDCGGGRERYLTVEREVLGFETDGRWVVVKAFVPAERGASCVPGKGGGGGGKRVRKDFVLETPTEESATAWIEGLRECIDSLGRPKMLLILVNPYGGKRSARKIFHSEVKPLLTDAGIYYTMQETKYQLHAQEIAYKLDLMKYDGILCVSGDGILVEALNGLLQRQDWQSAIRMPLGIIPAGTGNGMAKSLLDSVGDTCSVSNAVFAIIRGHKRPLDVSTVMQGETKFFSALMLSWGLVADIDIESEKYRWMGSARIDFYALLRVINLRKYHGRVSFVPAPGYETYGKATRHVVMCDENSEIHTQGEDIVPRCGYQGPMSTFKSSEWRSIEGPFVAVWLHNVPWASNDAMPAPEAKFSDGYVDLIVIKDCPKSALAALCLKMNDGSHIKSPYVIYLKVKAFRLEPGNCVGNPSKGGIIDSDGEVIARGRGTYQCHEQEDLMEYGPPIQMTVDQGLATIFAPR